MKLPTSQWIAAKSYISSHARPLEQYLFAFLFEGSKNDKAVEELSRYQNSDGGFGHSIEPDFRLEGSSPLATTIGLQYAKELNLPKHHTLIQNALTYLSHCHNEEINGWQAVPKEVNHVPHAPWWHFDEEKDNVVFKPHGQIQMLRL